MFSLGNSSKPAIFVLSFSNCTIIHNFYLMLVESEIQFFVFLGGGFSFSGAELAGNFTPGRLECFALVNEFLAIE